MAIMDNNQLINITERGILSGPNDIAIKPHIDEYKDTALITDHNALKPIYRTIALYKPNTIKMGIAMKGAANIIQAT